MNDLINYDFSEYLNRHLKGIIKLKDKINEIVVKYELSNAFSNHSCRFIIEVEFKDFELLSENEKQIAHKYFHNSSNSTGYGFVSFIYQRQNSHYIDFGIIKEFILHYEFSKNIFEGFVCNILMDKTKMEVSSLSEEPLFNYTINFLNKIKYDDENINDKNLYKIKMHRRFDFDIDYHKILVDATKEYKTIERRISDVEIFEKTGSNLEDIRRLILNKNIPFHILEYQNTIDEILIDVDKLKDVLKNYTPSSYESININKIIELITQREKAWKKSEKQLEKLILESGLQLGDYILVEKSPWRNIQQNLGVIKGFELNYNSLLHVIYNKLKVNMEESMLPNESTSIEDISYILKKTKTKELLLEKKRDVQIKMMKKIGTRSKKYKKRC